MSIKSTSDSDFLVRVAQMYYLENMSQAEIANVVGVSRPQVSKLLMKAREIGIVTITVAEVSDRLKGYETSLCQRHLLNFCRVVPECSSHFETERSIAQCALEQINKIAETAHTIGIGWGAMLNSVCDLGPIREHVNEAASVVPLIGSLNATNNGYNTNELVRKLGLILGMTPRYLYAPAFPQLREEQAQFLETYNFRQISGYWDQLDAAIFRIKAYPGVPDLATSSRYGRALEINKAVGVILSDFYDISGRTISGEMDFSISISRQQFMRTPVRLAVGANTTTPQSVLGALRTGMVTHLILSENMAREVLRLSGVATI